MLPAGWAGDCITLRSMARETVIIPEVVEPDEKLPPDLIALRNFAYLMDEAVRIPGTGRGIGSTPPSDLSRGSATPSARCSQRGS